MRNRILVALAAVVIVPLLLLFWLGTGGLGNDWGAGVPGKSPLPESTILARTAEQGDAAHAMGIAGPKQILFGDLHVHSTFSLDAFMMALPTAGGEGAHPVSDACDFARHCSALDFWSINDHALGLNPRAWQETVNAIRQCNELAGTSGDPDVSAFLGWEWTQMGTNPDNHYGHKNVIIRGLADDEIPTRPIAARAPADAWDRSTDSAPGTLALGALSLIQPTQDSWDLVRFFAQMLDVAPCPDGVAVRDLPADCRESTLTPATLFDKLDDWGFDSMVIPHGTTWGYYTPHGSAWDKQLNAEMHDPARQRLIEIYSGHGNSEEWRDWQEVAIADDGSRSCPKPRGDFLPGCWRAGEIIADRCRAEGHDEDECTQRASVARQNFVEADIFGHLTVPGADYREWLDSDQCRDCFQPSFNYRPKSSAQYIMALRNFDDPQAPEGFEFGFMASSDNHSSRPGTGYKEYGRIYNTEARLPEAGTAMLSKTMPFESPPPSARSIPFGPDSGGVFFNLREAERASSFFLTGGLIAVHSPGRGRDEIWNAMQRKEVYGTSGPRILLWFDLLNPPGSSSRAVPMGGEATLDANPIFQVRAVGSLEQQAGCSESSAEALGPDRLEQLCRGECYNPSDQRRIITRIEVVRIRPQERPGEPIDPLIEDAWRVFECDPDPTGCGITFTDPDFAAGQRDVLYYARAIEAPIQAINAGLLRCNFDAQGQCMEVDACLGSGPPEDECLAETEQRAWSSPIFIDWGGATASR